MPPFFAKSPSAVNDSQKAGINGWVVCYSRVNRECGLLKGYCWVDRGSGWKSADIARKVSNYENPVFNWLGAAAFLN
jgi:hypothetical protein